MYLHNVCPKGHKFIAEKDREECPICELEAVKARFTFERIKNAVVKVTGNEQEGTAVATILTEDL
jgi:hypothetical protein